LLSLQAATPQLNRAPLSFRLAEWAATKLKIQFFKKELLCIVERAKMTTLRPTKLINVE
jgi:hypothetical protein